MSKKAKFHETLHVVRIEDPTGDSFLSVLEDGPADTSTEDGQPMAVYQLVSEGAAKVERGYEAKTK